MICCLSRHFHSKSNISIETATANEMKVFCSNPNLSYSQNPRFRVRVSPPNLSFLENSLKDAIFGPKKALFLENLIKTSELLSR